ncbi:hypothetical protein GPECTOR_4g670 [Gonium pectorale]|uniref:Uncharacterized protein n=1 Tax=Gonium pectorale TaxID=33097 RepID=A0A150GXR2_GONPE|nr:hypothetical protein GPECTOR_4g670 [Gonium pectorale]|eukprot:KXZ54605.1 hypothetical protein GPECTOR_4g670 [Gonium pectorale]
MGYAAGPYYMAHMPTGAMVMGLHHASNGGNSGDASREGSAHGANHSGAATGRDGGSSSGGGAAWRGGVGRNAGAVSGAGTGAHVAVGKHGGQYGQQQMGHEGGPAYGVAHMHHGPYAVYGMMAPGIVVPQVLSPVVGSPRGPMGEPHHMGTMLVSHGHGHAAPMAMGHMHGHMGSVTHHAHALHGPYPPHGHMGAGHHMSGLGHMGHVGHAMSGHHHNHHQGGYPPPHPHSMTGGGYPGGGGGSYGPYGHMVGGSYGSARAVGKNAGAQQPSAAGQKTLQQAGRSGASSGLSGAGGSGNAGGSAGAGSGRESPTGGRARAKADKPRAQEQRERKPGNARAPTAVAQCAAQVPELDAQLRALAERLAPGEEELAAHQLAFEAVRSLVASSWPEVKVYLFGSAANGLSIAGANSIDVTLEVPGMVWDDHAAKAAMVTALGELAAGGPLTAATVAPVVASEPELEGNKAEGMDAESAVEVQHELNAPVLEGTAAADTPAAAEVDAGAAAAVVGEGEGGVVNGRPQGGLMQSVTALPKARTPIVKLTVPATQTRVDITINNLLALSNTRLVADYARLDGRLRQLTLLVKHWARTRCVNDAYRGSLSSYAYVLLCIWLLQQRRPPVLPVLQARQPHTYDVTVGPWRCSYNDQLDELQDFGASNGESLAELLVAFFDHWAWRHDYNGAVVCVRTGGTTTKAAKEWTKRQGNERHLMCIEDPFELSHDLGRTIDKAAVQVLRREFERAAKIFATNPDPLPELLAPLTPEEEATVAAALQSRRRAAKEREKEKERAKLAAAAAAAAGGDGAVSGDAEAVAALPLAVTASDEADGEGEGSCSGLPGHSRGSDDGTGDADPDSEGTWSGEVHLHGDGSLSRQAQAAEPASAQAADPGHAATVAQEPTNGEGVVSM